MYQKWEEKKYVHFCRNFSKDCLRISVGGGGPRLFFLVLIGVVWRNLAQLKVQ